MKDDTGHMNGASRFKHVISKVFLGKRLKLSDKVNLKCPRCCSKMENVEKEGVVIDICPFCNGMFLDDGEIEKLVEIANKKLPVKKTGKKTSKRTKRSSKKASKKSAKRNSRK
ncbi:MAG: zf-TFIIB domain-containing protein [Nanobdellota archaeon]